MHIYLLAVNFTFNLYLPHSQVTLKMTSTQVVKTSVTLMPIFNLQWGTKLLGQYYNEAETNCRIAHILGILLMNSYNTDIFFLATTIICSLSALK